MLKVGMKLKLPSTDNSAAKKAKVHVVRRGENLSLIAAKYNVSMSDIKVKNKIRNPSSIAIGERILIPSEESHQ